MRDLAELEKCDKFGLINQVCDNVSHFNKVVLKTQPATKASKAKQILYKLYVSYFKVKYIFFYLEQYRGFTKYFGVEIYKMANLSIKLSHFYIVKF